MSIFDKPEGWDDNLDDFIGTDQEFLVLAMVDDGPVQTKLGTATRTKLTVATMDNPGEPREVSTLAAAIANMAASLEPGDLPAVCVKEHYTTKYGNQGTAIKPLRKAGDLATAPVPGSGEPLDPKPNPGDDLPF